MSICFRCGAENSRVSDFLVEEGIVGLCEDCVSEDDLPVKKTAGVIFEDNNSGKTVRERLSASAGINPEKHRSFENRVPVKKEHDKSLRIL
jgi:hypothetical protein